ncbi:MAG: single-stranded-DNA-specific exonuclease RecJ, partial [Clostridia bacterium]|nr:single-stranded-DNA-specific exonuclease RecJ [Clostridia bacterium]
SYRVPLRDEGYGISVSAVGELKEKGVQVIITVDNGITAFEAVDFANKLGIDVVVTDHHLPSEKLPNAFAVIDPKRADCPSEFKDYAGVGVALMFCSALCDAPFEDLIYSYGDLVAIGTIADVMPILNDNRGIVKLSLELIKNSSRLGLKALVEESGLKKDSFNTSSVSFGIAPRINAAGRVLDPNIAIDLLLSTDEEQSKDLAKKLCEANIKRQQLEKDILKQAEEKLSADNSMINAPDIIVSGENWHSGVIGIVAARLCETFSRPAIVFSFDGKMAHGSARSVDNASIYNIIAENPEFVDSFGGHSSAAGISVKKENFKKAVVNIENSAKKLYPEMPFNQLEITCKLNPKNVDINTVYAQKVLMPFGEKNEQPIYALCDMVIKNITELSGGKHLKIAVSRQGEEKTLEVMKFFTTMSEFAYKTGDRVDIAVTLESSIFNGIERVSVIVKDIKPFGVDADKTLKELRKYQNFKYFGEDIELKIERQNIVDVYLKIRNLKKITANETELLLLFGKTDFLRLRVILDILFELDFIKFSYSGNYNIEYIENVKKKDLTESSVYNLFC